jgi:hypothetical protein
MEIVLQSFYFVQFTGIFGYGVVIAIATIAGVETR